MDEGLSPPQSETPPRTETKEVEAPGGPGGRVVVPRWVQLVGLPLLIVALWLLAHAAGKVIELFIVAGIIALVLNPLVSAIQRLGLPRGLAVLAVYLGFFLLVAAVGYL